MYVIDKLQKELNQIEHDFPELSKIQFQEIEHPTRKRHKKVK